jgi:hypothetical protein
MHTCSCRLSYESFNLVKSGVIGGLGDEVKLVNFQDEGEKKRRAKSAELHTDNNKSVAVMQSYNASMLARPPNAPLVVKRAINNHRRKTLVVRGGLGSLTYGMPEAQGPSSGFPSWKGRVSSWLFGLEVAFFEQVVSSSLVVHWHDP